MGTVNDKKGMTMTRVLTIGYESASLDDFLQTLSQQGVNVLLDVREIPISRRKGFSKTALSNAVTGVGMQYVHNKLLGSPKNIRNRLRETKDFDTYFREFDAYLNTQRPLLKDIARQVQGTVALVCYEKDYRQCHRSSVARELGNLIGVKPQHLGVTRNGARPIDQRKDVYPRQGISTTQHEV